MMFFCPVCGRRRFVHQPQFWPYRFDGEMFCSENCWICDVTKKDDGKERIQNGKDEKRRNAGEEAGKETGHSEEDGDGDQRVA